MRRALLLLVTACCVARSTPAAAQLLATDDQPGLILMTTTTSSAIAVGVVMLTVVNTRKDPTVLRQYLRQNEPAVRSAFALGGGPAVADLAMLFDVPQRRSTAFGRLLRRHRVALSHAAYADADVARFTELVDTAMHLDPALRDVVARP